MTGSIFWLTLRHRWRFTLLWGIGLALIGWVTMAAIPNMESLQRLGEALANMPPVMLQMLGVENVADLAGAEGFLASAYFARAIILMAVFAVVVGLAISSGEESDGILDVVLSLPVPRWRLQLERFLAYALIGLVVIAFSWLGLWVGLRGTEIVVNEARMLDNFIALAPLTLSLIALAMLCGAVFNSRGLAVGAASGLVLAGYIVSFLGGSTEGSFLNTLSPLSPFHYYNANAITRDGLNAGNMGLLLAVTVVLVSLSLWVFQRRDVGV
jgi:ABC-2 type transport system permease protein